MTDLPKQNYNEFSRFLSKSLVMLDDEVPGYTVNEQFANTGVAFPNKPVVAYNARDFGIEYLKYLKRENISPDPLQFLDGQSNPDEKKTNVKNQAGAKMNAGAKNKNVADTISLPEILNRFNLDRLKRVIDCRELQYFQPFMVTDSSSAIAETLNLQATLDGETVRKLNNKFYMKKIANEENVRILGNCLAEDAGQAQDIFDELSKDALPLILKSCLSCGGQGNYVINNRQMFVDFLKSHFEEKKPFIIEPLIEVKQSPCTLYFIDPSGAVHYLGVTEQIIKNKSTCIGSKYPAVLNPKALEDIFVYSQRLAERIASEGYYGPLGFDFVVDSSDTAFFLESNVRVNYSNCLLDLLNHKGMSNGLISDIIPERDYKDMGDVLARIKTEDLLTDTHGGVFPFYPQLNCTRLKAFAVLVLGDDEQFVASKYREYSEKLR